MEACLFRRLVVVVNVRFAAEIVDMVVGLGGLYLYFKVL